MYQIIDGKKTSADIKAELSASVNEMKVKGIRVPHLAAILVGNDGASETYVANKVKACEEIGFESTLRRFESSITEAELLAEVEKMNNDPLIDGFIVQLPLPGHISEEKIIESVSPEKDVDGYHPISLGRLVAGLPGFVSATPLGVVELLKRYSIKTSGANCVVVGRSVNVGRPLSILLSQKGMDATVTVVHSRTKNIQEVLLNADIIIAAIGSPAFIKAEMVKEGAVVIDIGTTRVPDTTRKSGFRLSGDVDFEHVAPKCSYITPVPGGVGPMTIASLMLNTLKACKR
ncbi:MAG TPA: tetrahydrofolate dehydrogenase/cyclohydrolase catalytic domain-containing protein [Bacteroidales bacterium]|nr:tetrahydrofolate dehydrogenase/cyclohydrolase catalytic domain-containing protein [Bacteroidales bacterium]HPT11492.1 tetrahydrofolate dehydrogenase/cyclohydrolase catalytic domain-containing protein [Bacteroidales bacterium]